LSLLAESRSQSQRRSKSKTGLLNGSESLPGPALGALERRGSVEAAKTPARQGTSGRVTHVRDGIAGLCGDENEPPASRQDVAGLGCPIPRGTGLGGELPRRGHDPRQDGLAMARACDEGAPGTAATRGTQSLFHGPGTGARAVTARALSYGSASAGCAPSPLSECWRFIPRSENRRSLALDGVERTDQGHPRVGVPVSAPVASSRSRRNDEIARQNGRVAGRSAFVVKLCHPPGGARCRPRCGCVPPTARGRPLAPAARACGARGRPLRRSTSTPLSTDLPFTP